MPDYQESTVAGTAWRRFNQIRIDNTRRAVPVIYIDEEQVVALDDGRELRQPVGTLELPYFPDYPITLFDPATGTPTGQTATLADAYALVYSVCLQQALIRDGVLPQPGSESEPQE